MINSLKIIALSLLVVSLSASINNVGGKTSRDAAKDVKPRILMDKESKEARKDYFKKLSKLKLTVDCAHYAGGRPTNAERLWENSIISFIVDSKDNDVNIELHKNDKDEHLDSKVLKKRKKKTRIYKKVKDHVRVFTYLYGDSGNHLIRFVVYQNSNNLINGDYSFFYNNYHLDDEPSNVDAILDADADSFQDFCSLEFETMPHLSTSGGGRGNL